MYQNMRVPVITGDFITNSDICTVREIKADGEFVDPVYIDTKHSAIKYGVLIEYGNYLYIENKQNSTYEISIYFLNRSQSILVIKPGTTYSIKICCDTFLSLKSTETNELVLTTL